MTLMQPTGVQQGPGRAEIAQREGSRGDTESAEAGRGRGRGCAPCLPSQVTASVSSLVHSVFYHLLIFALIIKGMYM